MKFFCILLFLKSQKRERQTNLEEIIWGIRDSEEGLELGRDLGGREVLEGDLDLFPMGYFLDQ